jgi:hypothetical protein
MVVNPFESPREPQTDADQCVAEVRRLRGWATLCHRCRAFILLVLVVIACVLTLIGPYFLGIRLGGMGPILVFPLIAVLAFGVIGVYSLLEWLVRKWLRGRIVKLSDSDRRHGWVIEQGWLIESEGYYLVAELEYLRSAPHRQFWHEYRVRWIDPEDAVTSTDEWNSAELDLYNPYYKDFAVAEFLTSFQSGEVVVSFRIDFVPKELR